MVPCPGLDGVVVSTMYSKYNEGRLYVASEYIKFWLTLGIYYFWLGSGKCPG